MASLKKLLELNSRTNVKRHKCNRCSFPCNEAVVVAAAAVVVVVAAAVVAVVTVVAIVVALNGRNVSECDINMYDKSKLFSKVCLECFFVC